MQALTEAILNQHLGGHILNEAQIARLLGGSPARRHGIVNRALKAGELQRIKRGRYIVDSQLTSISPHPFALAQAFVAGSYISFESALSWHGWIPEAVYTTTSVTPKRKSKEYNHEHFGQFSFQPLATLPGAFFQRVKRIQVNNQVMLVAHPVRALMDLACIRKWDWQGLEYLCEGLRIEIENLQPLSSSDTQALQQVYRHKRMKTYIQSFAEALEIA